MRSPQAQQPTQRSRLSEWWEGMPLATASILALCVAIHAVNFLFTVNSGWLSINAARVLYNYEIYRVFSSAFTHGGILHILMNMMSLLSLGGSIERKFGTLQFAIISLWTVVLTGALYVVVCWALAWYITSDMSWLWHSAVGYSGVLFAYAVIETHHSEVTHRSVFGLFQVPARIYPWVLLVVLQVIIPGISFLGHLSGIVIGALIVYGAVNFVLPSVGKGLQRQSNCGSRLIRCGNSDGMQALEQARLAGLLQKPQYIACASRDMCVTRAEGGALLSAVGYGICFVCTFISNVLVTFMHMVGCPPEDIAAGLRQLWNTRWTSHGTYTGVPQNTQDVERGAGQ